MPETFTPERYERLCQLVDQAETLPEHARAAFLETACAGDVTLLEKARGMLASRSRTQFKNFLAGTAPISVSTAGALGDESLIGQRIGRYELQAQIATGGMGAIFRAVRVDDYREVVAVKIIRAGMNTREFVERFQTERQVLASLRHPNIATLLDGGTTADGRPYIVMEFIDGLPITTFCDRHRLGIDQRLKLLKITAGAVQYAHQRTVLHRDLKPSNILVTAQGIVKLVDFGIAKLTRPEAFGLSAAQTLPGDRALTPEYASPEQVRGDFPTSASDVYSLGVVMYELMTGRAPYDLTGLSWGQMEKVICEQLPLPPSAVIGRSPAGEKSDERHKASDCESIAHARRASTKELRRQLRGDLDNIALMALRKEPERRYATVDRLAADLDFYIKGLPVAARKDTWAYRTHKFIKRNRWYVAAAALIVISLVGGLIGTSIGLNRASTAEQKAQRRFDDVRALATQSVFDINDRVTELPGGTPVRDYVVTIGLEYLDRLAAEAGDERPDLLYDLCKAYLRAGDAAGNPYFSSLGKHALALTAYRKAEEFGERLVALDPDNSTYAAALFSARSSIVDVLGATQGVDVAYQKQVELAEQAAEQCLEFPESIEWLRNRAGALRRLSIYEGRRGRMAESLQLSQDAIVLAKQIAAERPDDADSQREIYAAYNQAALAAQGTGNSALALEYLPEAIAAVEKLRDRGVATRADLFARAAMEMQRAEISRRTSFDAAAEQSYRTAVAVYTSLANEDPRDLRAQSCLAEASCHLALLIGNDNPEQALALAEQSQQRLQPFLADGHAQVMGVASNAYGCLGDCYSKMKKPEEAKKAYREAVRLAEQVIAKDPNVDNYISLAYACRSLADFLESAGDLQEAEQVLQPVKEWLTSCEAQQRDNGWFLEQQAELYGLLADVCAKGERWDEGIVAAEKASAAADSLATRDRGNFTRQSVALQALDRLARLCYARATTSNSPNAEDRIQAIRCCKEQARRWDELFRRGAVPQEHVDDARALQKSCADYLAMILGE